MNLIQEHWDNATHIRIHHEEGCSVDGPTKISPLQLELIDVLVRARLRVQFETTTCAVATVQERNIFLPLVVYLRSLKIAEVR